MNGLSEDEGNINDEEGENIEEEEHGRNATTSYIKCKPSIQKDGHEESKTPLQQKIQQSISSRAQGGRASIKQSVKAANKGAVDTF